VEYRPRMPNRWMNQFLDDFRRRESEGDDKAVLDALALCLEFDLIVPEWLARTFFARYEKVRDFEAGSWDEVFGRPHKKGIHLERAKRKIELCMPVLERVKEIVENESVAIGAGLFERVGREFGISKTVCEELYYKALKM
jgi:hypothetical protein